MDTRAIRKGDRVTGQHRTWYDGTAIANWPHPQYLGTVREVATLGGVLCARVKYDSGRLEWTSADQLTAIPDGGAA